MTLHRFPHDTERPCRLGPVTGSTVSAVDRPCDRATADGLSRELRPGRPVPPPPVPMRTGSGTGSTVPGDPTHLSTTSSVLRRMGSIPAVANTMAATEAAFPNTTEVRAPIATALSGASWGGPRSSSVGPDGHPPTLSTRTCTSGTADRNRAAEGQRSINQPACGGPIPPETGTNREGGPACR